ncbi:hypothetical protein PRIPAC_88227 [Pristionchus pacificus]|nr:hypothetical protein PRIPAC_88227 [Pristionchus pacificus]
MPNRGDGTFADPLKFDWNGAIQISRGAQGVVYRVPSRSGEVAVKTGVAEDEIERLKRLCHSNIIQFSGITTFNNHTAMVMEYVDRNLRQHLDRGRLNKNSFLEITRGIADGLVYIHDKGMTHRDIKSHNILVQLTMTGQCIPKIADFGIAREVPKEWTRMRIIGSYHYMAPELLIPERITGTDEDAVQARRVQLAKLEPRMDTWSFGCLVWEMLSGLVPYIGCDPVTLPTMVAKGQLRIPLPHNSMESLLNMLQRCLVIMPEFRSTMHDIVEMSEELTVEMKGLTDDEWSAEQQKYLDELALHGFKSRSATDMLKSRDSQMRKRVGDFLKEGWDEFARPILKNLLRRILMLSGDSEKSANNTVIWVSDHLYKICQSDGYRTFANCIERPIGFVLCNLLILARDGPYSENFMPFK